MDVFTIFYDCFVLFLFNKNAIILWPTCVYKFNEINQKITLLKKVVEQISEALH